MIAIIYRCPVSGLTVDHWVEPAENSETYETVSCRACNRVHVVNVSTGRVLVANNQEMVGTSSAVQPGGAR